MIFPPVQTDHERVSNVSDGRVQKFTEANVRLNIKLCKAEGGGAAESVMIITVII